jgi:hypothetical protein
MEKKQLKLRKETLTNLTNLNQKEMEELKGGVAAKQEMVADVTISFSDSITVGVTFTYSWSW